MAHTDERYQSKQSGKVYQVLHRDRHGLSLVPVHGQAFRVHVTHQVFGACFMRVSV